MCKIKITKKFKINCSVGRRCL